MTGLIFTSCKRDGRVNWGNESAKEKITLRFNPPEGKEMHGQLKMNSKLSIIVMGQKPEALLEMDADYLLNALGKNGNGYNEMAVEVDAVDIKLTLPEIIEGKQIVYNSDDVGDTEEAQFIDGYVREYLGKAVTIQLDDRGGVHKVGEIDEAIAQLTEEEREQMQGAFERIMGDNLIEKLINLSAILPEEPVKLGDSWDSEVQSVIAGVPINMNNDLTLVDRKDGLAEIALKSVLEVDTIRLNTEGLEGFSELPGGGSATRVLIKGSQTGNLFVDETTGMTRESHLTQEIEMEIKVAILTVPVTFSNQIDFTPAKQ